MNHNQMNVLGIACEPKAPDPTDAAVQAVAKCERIPLPVRLGPPDPLETLRVIQGSPSREQFVAGTLAPVVKSEAGNPELQRRAAQAVAAYCERHGLAVPGDVRKCLMSPSSGSRAAQATTVQMMARPTVVKRALSPSEAEVLRKQNAQIAAIKQRIADIQRRRR